MVTTQEENKRLVQKHLEAFNTGDLTAFLELHTEDVVLHGASEDYEGLEGIEKYTQNMGTAFPDAEVTAEDLFATEDRVAARFTMIGTHEGPFHGAEPTGREVELSGISIFRVEDGKIAEWWLESDQFGALQQLGVIESSTRESGD